MSKKQRQRLHIALSVVVTIGVAFFALLPLYWIVLTSLKAPGTEFRLPIRYWPDEISLEPYRTILGPDFNVQRAILNSLIVSTVTTIGALLLASLAAYTIARLRFTYKWSSLLFIQVASMLPPIIVIAPTFLIIRSMGLLGSLPGLIIPNMIYNIPLSTWLIASYFAGLPFELEDAAKVDGSPPLRIFRQIMLPLAAPGLFSAGVIAFLGSWGEFMLAFTISMGLPEAQTIPVAVQGYTMAMQRQWTWVAAAIVLSLAPVIVLVMVFQKWVVQGLTLGSAKY
ncbi:MAG: carbohydrate ABC transporter permease [Anaerolineae bacterium]|jgi:multiple sugar transport system permease protein|nr:carbohydrate ABC transporter permease [Anaerolineae bacterium]